MKMPASIDRRFMLDVKQPGCAVIDALVHPYPHLLQTHTC